MDAKSGKMIRVTVKSAPTSESAAKTLSRVFGRSAAGRKLRVSRKRVRESQMSTHQRGGRPWVVRPFAPRLYKPVQGDTCEVFATSALLRDLCSVARFVDIATV